jgi:hypothetical protein
MVTKDYTPLPPIVATYLKDSEAILMHKHPWIPGFQPEIFK